MRPCKLIDTEIFLHALAWKRQNDGSHLPTGISPFTFLAWVWFWKMFYTSSAWQYFWTFELLRSLLTRLEVYILILFCISVHCALELLSTQFWSMGRTTKPGKLLLLLCERVFLLCLIWPKHQWIMMNIAMFGLPLEVPISAQCSATADTKPNQSLDRDNINSGPSKT